jgi:hypothetical protein
LQLVGELKKSYWSDLKEVRGDGGGKSFDGTVTITANRSPTVPTMEGVALAGNPITLPDDFRGRTTLLVVGCRAFAQPQMDAYRTAFEAMEGGGGGGVGGRGGGRGGGGATSLHSRLQVLEVWFVERMIFQWMSGIFEKSLRKQVTLKQRQERTLRRRKPGFVIMRMQ